MPSPNAVSASNVNTELGVGSSAQLNWGNNWVRNVTTQFTGTNSTVNGSKMRWGINFPGGEDFNGIFTAQCNTRANADGLFCYFTNIDKVSCFKHCDCLTQSDCAIKLFTKNCIVHCAHFDSSGKRPGATLPASMPILAPSP